ncbi:MAG: hypothetical protein PGN34_20630 [Methylobacterium frigidaeris]
MERTPVPGTADEIVDQRIAALRQDVRVEPEIVLHAEQGVGVDLLPPAEAQEVHQRVVPGAPDIVPRLVVESGAEQAVRIEVGVVGVEEMAQLVAVVGIADLTSVEGPVEQGMGIDVDR